MNLTILTRTDPRIARRAQICIVDILATGKDQDMMRTLSQVHGRERGKLAQISRAISRTMD
jgi:hypothetical protein